MLPGDRVAWWRDATGDERGLLMAMPFAGGRAEPVFPSLPEGWLMGHSFEAGIAAISMEIGGAYRTYLIERDGTARVLADHEAAAGVGSLEPGLGGGLSADGALVCIQHAEHGDLLHAALRVLDTAHGRGGRRARGQGPQPRPRRVVAGVGDQRLAFTSELGAFERPAIWDVRSGDRRDLDIDLPERGLPRAMVARRRRAPRPPRTRGPRAARADRPRDRRDGGADGSRRRHRRRRHPSGRVGLVSRERSRSTAEDHAGRRRRGRRHRPTRHPRPGGPTRAASPRTRTGTGSRCSSSPRTDPVPSPRCATSTADPSGTSATGSTRRRRRSSTAATPSRS